MAPREDPMKADGKIVKEREKAIKAGKTQAVKKEDDLEPCTAPHAAEAARLEDVDEACEDGVN